MNDDLVQPARGFGTHPHGDMEIVTLVVCYSLPFFCITFSMLEGFTVMFLLRLLRGTEVL